MYVLYKHTNYFTEQRLLNTIIDSPTINTLNNALYWSINKKYDKERL